MRRVAITGLGVVSPVGLDVPSFWQALLDGRSGVELITAFPTDKLRSDVAANVKGFDPLRFLSLKESEIYGRVTHVSLAAAVEAMKHAGLSALLRESEDAPLHDVAVHGKSLDRARMGCLMSTGQGGVDVFEEQIERSRTRGPRAVSPYFIPGVMPNNSAALIAMRYGLMGPSYSLASACATGTHSIATCALMIEAGDADVMLAGGGEAATRLNTVAGFGNARALARSSAGGGDPTKASRPFDKKRAGFVMGEGAGALVLEAEEHAKARGARIYAYVTGFGMSTDAEHLTRPPEDGRGLALALANAMRRAHIGAADVDYINPHATSTPQGDVAEYLAVERILGARVREIPVSATKSMIGHLLGGAGAVESIATVLTLAEGVIHPSINVDEQDPQIGFHVVREKRRADVRRAIKLSAGFGGHNCALVFERA